MHIIGVLVEEDLASGSKALLEKTENISKLRTVTNRVG